MRKYPDIGPFSADYIRKVLDPDDPRKNNIIIDEAITLRDELLDERDRMEGRIFRS